ncbi:hypothetical protein Taro_017621 [Colocasia esculenta]|uniref:Uncharacterized protein n=1 Tax=Colocasia esculenta TaxID=4460 RepID=A0A843UNL4_COLES|nr:hypothetical protein [Colocasia esculenta]
MWMRNEYWIELCDIWGVEKWNENYAKAKQNRAAHPEAFVHTSGSVSFATHKVRLEVQLKRPPQFQELFDETHKKKGTNDYISEKAREVAESYSRGMDERYGDDSQRPELDPDIWVAASRAPKKGHVYGFGHSLGTARTVSQTLAQLGILGDRAPPAQQPPDHPSRDVGRDEDHDDTYAEDL